MPCTWTGYGASPPAAYKYRGEQGSRGGGRFLRKRGTNQGEIFWESRGKQAAETKKKGETRGGKTFEKRT